MSQRFQKRIVSRAVPALRKRSYRRSRMKRGHKKPRLSILTSAGMIGGAVATFSEPGDCGIAEQIYGAATGQKQWVDVPRVIVRETIGYDYGARSWHIPAFTALTGLGLVGSKIAGKFIKPSTFDAIPFVGKHIKL